MVVRHGVPVVDPQRPPAEWPLAPDAAAAVCDVARCLPPGVEAALASPERKAVATAHLLVGSVAIAEGLREVGRPWVEEGYPVAATRYLAGEPLAGWEPHADALARFADVVAGAGARVVIVSHGLAMSLYFASRVPELDPAAFWAGLRMPDGWMLGPGGGLRRL